MKKIFILALVAVGALAVVAVTLSNKLRREQDDWVDEDMDDEEELGFPKNTNWYGASVLDPETT